MEYLYVKNFEKFQHYKNRDGKPSWIKLHVSLIMDAAFGDLTETQQAHLLKVWLIASQDNGKVVADPSLVRRQIGARSPVNLELFVNKGFLVKKSRADFEDEAPPKEKKREEDIKQKKREDPVPQKDSKFKPTALDLNLAQTMMRPLPAQLSDGEDPADWAGDIQKLRMIHKLNDSSILKIWDFARGDPFWSRHIISPGDLLAGKKLKKLQAQMLSENNPNGAGPQPRARDFYEEPEDERGHTH